MSHVGTRRLSSRTPTASLLCLMRNKFENVGRGGGGQKKPRLLAMVGCKNSFLLMYEMLLGASVSFFF